MRQAGRQAVGEYLVGVLNIGPPRNITELGQEDKTATLNPLSLRIQCQESEAIIDKAVGRKGRSKEVLEGIASIDCKYCINIGTKWRLVPKTREAADVRYPSTRLSR